MPGIDIFNDNAFGLFSLTAAINKVPYSPKFLRDLGIFKQVSVRTTNVAVEDRQGTLALLPTAGRGSMRNERVQPARTIRDFRVPHVPYFQTIMADDVQNIRAFGSESELETVMDLVNDQLIGMRNDHEATMEYHRVGAVQGKVLDHDGTTVIYDYFSEFVITLNQVDINLTTNTNVRGKCHEILREIAGALGMTPFSKAIAICGNTYFDAFVANASVKEGYERWQSSQFFRDSLIGPEYTADMNGFDFGGITWVNYRGQIGAVPFFPANEARIFPVGVPDLFLEVAAPADFIETVNTRGLPFYAKQRPLPFDKGIELHTQSNVLYIATRPAALIKSVNA